jgi:calmodulin
MQSSSSMSTLSDESTFFIPDNKLKITLPTNLSHGDNDSTSQSSNETIKNPSSSRKIQSRNQVNKSLSNSTAHSPGSSWSGVDSKLIHNSDVISAYTDEADDEQDDMSSIQTNNQSILYDSFNKKQSKIKQKSFKTRDEQFDPTDRNSHAQHVHIASSKQLFNTDYDEDDFMDAFRVFDLNGDGRITAKELNYALKELGIKMKKKDIEKMINELDKDKNGTIEYSEFVQMMTMPASREADEFELREAFRCIDTDGNGYISREELRQAVEKIMSMDKKISMQDVEEMMREADVDGNGLIDFDEFVRILVDKRN